MANSLDPATIASLLSGVPDRKYAIPEQVGPLRFVDTMGRCASRGCRAPSHMKVNGIYYCSMHTMRRLNEIIVEMNERG